MKGAISLAIVFSLVGGNYASSQVDDQLKSLHINDFAHFNNADTEDEVEFRYTKREETKVLVLKQLFIEKGKDAWMYDVDSCGLKRLKAIQMAYMGERTKAIYCGLSFSQGIKKRKEFRSVSYPVLEELKVGDTLKMDLVILADKHHEFRPYIYTSEKIKLKKGKLKNGSYLSEQGKVPVGSKNDQDVVNTQIRIPITEENKEIAWIHLVNDEDSLHRGFIIQSNYDQNEQIDDAFQKVYYANDSYRIDKKNQVVLEQIIVGLQPNQYVSLRGYADPSGDKTYNLQLAKKRAVAVRDFMVANGVDPNRITIEEINILHNSSSKENRICTILVL